MPTSNTKLATPRTLEFALFVTGLLWLLAARTAAFHAAQGFATHFDVPVFEPLMSAAFLLALLLFGLTALNWIATRGGDVRSTNALPARATAGREFRLGAALGWAMLVAALVPLVVLGAMHSQFWLAGRSWALALLSLVTLSLGTLAIEVAYRGYLYRKLIDAFGTVAATVLLAGLYAVVSSFGPNSTSLSVTAEFAFGILFSLAYLRTHALWLGWGMHFAWTAVMGVLFGLPVCGLGLYSSVVSTDLSGPVWLTGGAYGPEGSIAAIAVVLAGTAVLYRMTRDYAWEYTHPPIVAGGYPVEAQPPAAHVAMERSAQFTAAAAPAPLVQILGTTSTNSSTVTEIDQHLKGETSAPGE